MAKVKVLVADGDRRNLNIVTLALRIRGWPTREG